MEVVKKKDEEKNEMDQVIRRDPKQQNEAKGIIEEATTQVSRLKSEANEILKIAMEEKAMALEKRQEAKCLIELANLGNGKETGN
ncbi:hypothetical protein HAX54_024891 [Datura stramonium]|uniref:Uncharacterized protein n=1 Tax=Datura stramonium TaxID=4076 RepID=A0ABS8S5V5_DATST|nr:hypothetical protein [Datura stramonium]